MLRLGMASIIHHAPSARALEGESAQADEQTLLTLLKEGNPSAALALARDLTQRFAGRGPGLGAIRRAFAGAAHGERRGRSLRILPILGEPFYQ